MTDSKNALSKLITDCWKNHALKIRFQNEPNTVLAEYGIDVPDDMLVKVLENAKDRVHIILPESPEKAEQLTDAELLSAAGASGATICSAVCTSWNIDYCTPCPIQPSVIC